MIISESHIRARRASLAAQLAEAQQQYDQSEATLRLLGRNLDAMQGGLQELDALLVSPAEAEARCEIGLIAGAGPDSGGAVAAPAPGEQSGGGVREGDQETGGDPSE
jgi:hypothetical protein